MPTSGRPPPHANDTRIHRHRAQGICDHSPLALLFLWTGSSGIQVPGWVPTRRHPRAAASRSLGGITFTRRSRLRQVVHILVLTLCRVPTGIANVHTKL